MPRPNWHYVKIDTQLPDNDKWDGCPLTTQLVSESTLTRALSYCLEALTDGHITLSRWAKIGSALGRRTLVERGFVIQGPDGIEIPHYLDYYPSKADVEVLRKKRSESGRKGGQAKQAAKQAANQSATTADEQVARPALKPYAKAETDSYSVAVSAPLPPRHRPAGQAPGEFHAAAAARAAAARPTPQPPAWQSPGPPPPPEVAQQGAATARAALAKIRAQRAGASPERPPEPPEPPDDMPF